MSVVTFAGREYRKVPRRFDKGLVVPSTGKFMRLKRDAELAEWDYKPSQASFPLVDRNNTIPATRRFRTLPPDYPNSIVMSDAWCWRCVDMIWWASDYSIDYQEAVKVWRKFIEFHTACTDGYSPEQGYRDPVTKENNDSPKGNIHFLNLGFAGNIVKRLDDGRIEAFDMLLPPPPLEDILTIHRHKWGWATEQRPDGVISNFPHIEAVCGSPCGMPVPIPSYGGFQVINSEYLERVDNGKEYDVYYRG